MSILNQTGINSGKELKKGEYMEVKEMHIDLRPREKLFANGVKYLSDKELLAIILGSGIKGKGVFSLSEEILNVIDSKSSNIDIDSLTSISGMGKAKAALLSAAMEFSRRILIPEKNKISSPSDIYPAVKHYADRHQETFLSVSLNGAHEIIKIRIVSIGLVNRTLVHPREVYADPIGDRAAAIIVAHNHPSGNTKPSSEDREVTNILKKSGKILGIELLDHIVFSDTGFYSFLENGEI